MIPHHSEPDCQLIVCWYQATRPLSSADSTAYVYLYADLGHQLMIAQVTMGMLEGLCHAQLALLLLPLPDQDCG